MRRGSKYRLFIWVTILTVVVLAATLAITSVQILTGEKLFAEHILDEHKFFLKNTIGFAHAVMRHMNFKDYQKLIDLALELNSIQYFGVLGKDGRIMIQSDPPNFLSAIKDNHFSELKDGGIIEKTKEILLISYQFVSAQTQKGIPDETDLEQQPETTDQVSSHPRPEWFLVGVNISAFNKHYKNMIVQTLGTGSVLFLLGLLLIVFLGIIQRYELAHLSIEKLKKIKRLLGHFVPQFAKNIIESRPEEKGLLDKYIQDVSILFLDIEGFSRMSEHYPQERINHVIESYFSIFLDMILKNKGDINETAGDGMMVIFLHLDPVQHPRNAIQAALEIQDYCGKVSHNDNSGLFPVQVNIGIQSGKAYLGSTKMRGIEGERWTLTASGAVTVIAARLAQYAKGGQTLIGDEAAKRAGNSFSLTAIGKIPLKNIKDSGEVYEISHQR